MDNQMKYAIGLDLGGTKILAALINNSGVIVDQVELKTPTSLGELAIRDQVITSIQLILNKNLVAIEQILGIGVATAGVIDTNQSIIVQATNLGLYHAPIGKWIEDEFGFWVRIGNDANVAAVGEWLFGKGRGYKDLVYITVSTGIGAGLISGGQLVRGIGNSAGEFGHISIEPEGPLCSCGNRGCLENYSSGTALVKRVQEKMDSGQKSDYLDSLKGCFTSKEIAQAAFAGDVLAKEAFEEIGHYLGIGLTNLIHILNPEIVIFGGGVMNAAELLLPTVERIVHERCIPRMSQQVTIVKSALGSEAGIKGAAGLIFANDNKEIPIFNVIS
jgi:glucokinase